MLETSSFQPVASLRQKLKDYLDFSRVKNAFLEDYNNKQQIVSGRAIFQEWKESLRD